MYGWVHAPCEIKQGVQREGWLGDGKGCRQLNIVRRLNADLLEQPNLFDVGGVVRREGGYLGLAEGDFGSPNGENVVRAHRDARFGQLEICSLHRDKGVLQ